jgi:hypothetical protein
MAVCPIRCTASRKCPNAWDRDHDTDISLSMFVLYFRGRTRRLPGPLECCRFLLRNKHSTYRLTEEQGEVLLRVAESLKHETSWSFQQQSQALLEEPTCHDELGERMGFPKEHEALPWNPFRLPSASLDVSTLSVSVFFTPEASKQLSSCSRTRPRRANPPRLPPNVTAMD